MMRKLVIAALFAAFVCLARLLVDSFRVPLNLKADESPQSRSVRQWRRGLVRLVSAYLHEPRTPQAQECQRIGGMWLVEPPPDKRHAARRAWVRRAKREQLASIPSGSDVPLRAVELEPAEPEVPTDNLRRICATRPQTSAERRFDARLRAPKSVVSVAAMCVLVALPMLALWSSLSAMYLFPHDGKIRSHLRMSLAKIAISTGVLDAGQPMVDEKGGVYGGDGSTIIKNLRRLMRVDELVIKPDLFGAVGDNTADDTVAVQAAANDTSGRMIYVNMLHKITASLLIPATCLGLHFARGGGFYKNYSGGTGSGGALIRNADFTTPLSGFSISGVGGVVNPDPATNTGRLIAIYGNGTKLDDVTLDGWAATSVCIALSGDDVRVGHIWAINGAASAGADGIRFCGGDSFKADGAHVDSGDSTLGFVPIPPGSSDPMPHDVSITNSIFANCTGSSAVSNFCQASLNGLTSDHADMTCSIINSGYTGCLGTAGTDGLAKAQNLGSSGTVDVFFTDVKGGAGAGTANYTVKTQSAFAVGKVSARAHGCSFGTVVIQGNSTSPIDTARLNDCTIWNVGTAVQQRVDVRGCNFFKMRDGSVDMSNMSATNPIGIRLGNSDSSTSTGYSVIDGTRVTNVPNNGNSYAVDADVAVGGVIRHPIITPSAGAANGCGIKISAASSGFVIETTPGEITVPGNKVNNLASDTLYGYAPLDPAARYKAYTGAGSYTFTVPFGVTKIRVKAVGGGAGGGGGGAANNSGGTSTQCGGGAGSCGYVTEAELAVTPLESLTVTVGAGGGGGAGGTANGGAGTAGTNGGESDLDRSASHILRAQGGGRGAAASGNSSSNVGGGVPASSNAAAVNPPWPGMGGFANSTNSFGAGPPLSGAAQGGGGGGAATATLGGTGGSASLSAAAFGATVGPGSAGAAADVNGTAGATATRPGCGGGGGGGGAPTGTGGAGGDGADGQLEIWW